MLYELIVRFNYSNKCKKGYIWCTDSSFIHPWKFKKSGKEAYGYALDDHKVASLKRSTSTYNWSDAKSHCTKSNNSGKYGYCPDRFELYSLYSSIMYGKMKRNLIKAGLYEECNYRVALGNLGSESNWSYVWSSSECSSDYAYYVRYNGNEDYNGKPLRIYYIPFFKF